MNLKDNCTVVRTLRAGDEATFDAIYRYYHRALCLFCSTYVSAEEAEEIVQDLMLYIWERRDTLIEDMSLKSFLFTTAKHKALNLLTRNNISQRIYEEYQNRMVPDLSLTDSFQCAELLSIYVKTLRELPPEQQKIYIMSRQQHLTHKEIAQILDISVQTVNYRIGKALQLFRARLKEYRQE